MPQKAKREAEQDIGYVVNRLLRSRRVTANIRKEIRRLRDNYTPEERAAETVYVMVVSSEYVAPRKFQYPDEQFADDCARQGINVVEPMWYLSKGRYAGIVQARLKDIYFLMRRQYVTGLGSPPPQIQIGKAMKQKGINRYRILHISF